MLILQTRYTTYKENFVLYKCIRGEKIICIDMNMYGLSNLRLGDGAERYIYEDQWLKEMEWEDCEGERMTRVDKRCYVYMDMDM